MLCQTQISLPLAKFSLSVGTFCYLLICSESRSINFLSKHYDGFIFDQPTHDIAIELYLSSEYTNPKQNSSYFIDPEKPYFDYENGILRAYFYPEEKRFKVIMEESVFEGINIRLLDKFFCQVYYKLVNDNNMIGFVAHAAGIVRKNKGYVFSGRPGSGKSTIASLSCSNDKVLNDEILILEKIDKQFFVRSTPFAGGSIRKYEGSAPLNGVFLLKHASENSLRPLRKIEFIKMFVRELACPNSALFPNNKIDCLNMMDFCEQIYDNVPVYELCFRPDKSVWNLIDEAT